MVEAAFQVQLKHRETVVRVVEKVEVLERVKESELVLQDKVIMAGQVGRQVLMAPAAAAARERWEEMEALQPVVMEAPEQRLPFQVLL